jgi:hypothetical protein
MTWMAEACKKAITPTLIVNAFQHIGLPHAAPLFEGSTEFDGSRWVFPLDKPTSADPPIILPDNVNRFIERLGDDFINLGVDVSFVVASDFVACV